MSRTTNHTDILWHARNQEWAALHNLVSRVEAQHVRQAFYVLCKEGNAAAVDQLVNIFEKQHNFAYECVAGGIMHHIDSNTLALLSPLINPIADANLLQSFFSQRNKRPEEVRDCMLQQILALHKNHVLVVFKDNILWQIGELVRGNHTKSFFYLLDRYDLSDIKIAASVVSFVVRNMPHSAAPIFEKVGSATLENLISEKINVAGWNCDTVLPVIEWYLNQKQNARIAHHALGSNINRRRKI